MSDLTPAGAKARRKRRIKAGIAGVALATSVGVLAVGGTQAAFNSAVSVSQEGSAKSALLLANNTPTTLDLGPVFASMDGGETRSASYELEAPQSGGTVTGVVHITGPGAQYVSVSINGGGGYVDGTAVPSFAISGNGTAPVQVDVQMSNAAAAQGLAFGISIDWTLTA